MTQAELPELTQLKQRLRAIEAQGPESLSGLISIDLGVTYRVVMMTPECAKYLLTKNIENRPLNEPFMSRLIWESDNGHWKFNPNPICLGRDSFVYGGQHRLNLIVRTGRPHLVSLAENVPAEARDVLDKNMLATRPVQTLKMRGYDNVTARTGICRAVLLLETEDAAPISEAHAEAIMAHYGEDMDWALTALGPRRSVLAKAAFMYARGVNPSGVDAFAKFIKTSVGIDERSPAIPLIALLDTHIRQHSQKRSYMLRTLRAIIAHLEGETLRNLVASESSLLYFQTRLDAASRPVEPSP